MSASRRGGVIALPGRAELSGGLSAALVVIPIILSCGTVSYQTLGPDYAARGITAAFLTAIIAALVAWLFDGTVMHINSPKTSHAALLSLLMAQVAMNEPFARAASALPGGLPLALIGVAISALFVAGLTQMALGALRLGRLVRLLPRPVLAGLVNGFGLQIVLTQVPRAFGVGSFSELMHAPLSGGTVPWPLLVAVIAGLATIFGKRLKRVLPAPLLGLIVGSVVALSLDWLLPAASAGPRIGAVTIDMHALTSVRDTVLGFGWGVAGLAAFPVVQAGVTLALVSSIQSLLNLAAADTITGQRHDPDRSLLVQGGANLLAACIGGTPSGGSLNTTQAAHAAGAVNRSANLAHAVSLALMLLFCRGAIAVIPLSVMAAVVIVSTIGTLDSWSLKLLRRTALHDRGGSKARQWLDIATVIIVAILLLRDGALVAVMAGFTITTISFLGRTVQVFVRDVTYGDTQRSRTTRDAEASEALRREGKRIALLSLQGPLSFATAEPLIDRLEAMAGTADFIILDLASVTDADITGVFALRRARTSVARDGVTLFLAGLEVTPRLRAMFAEAGLELTTHWLFDTRHEALCHAEDALLQRLALQQQDGAEAGVADIVSGLSAEQAAVLAGHSVRRAYPAGAVIMRAGDPGDSICFLCSGEIGIVGAGAGRRVVLARYKAGTIFGEMALLTGHARSANVEALTEVVVREFSTASLEALGRVDSQVSYKVLRAIGRQLSERVADMSRTIAVLGG